MCLLMSIHGPHTFRIGRELLEVHGGYYLASGFDFPGWPIVTEDRPGEIQTALWGLIPFWSKNAEDARSIRAKTLNARSETMFMKPAYRDAARKGRCLVLADGFFEPHRHEGRSYPFFCRLGEGEAFAIAGLAAVWQNPESQLPETTFTIVTTDANDLMSRIHNEKRRMPVILESEERMVAWLAPGLTADKAAEICGKRDVPGLSAYPVTRDIWTRLRGANVPEVQVRVEYPELSGVL